MSENHVTSPAPKLRFPGFREDWREQPLGRLLNESRIPGSDGSVAKKLTVKLWGNGVVAKTEKISGSASTQYYRRRAGQFIYSKLDFLNGAFGVVPDHLDGFESTADLPCFDVAADLDRKFLFVVQFFTVIQARNLHANLPAGELNAIFLEGLLHP